ERLLGVGFAEVARNIEHQQQDVRAAAILTTDYASTAWFAFYLPSHPRIVQLDEEYRFDAAARADTALLARPLLYVVETRLDRHDLVTQHFQHVVVLARFDRLRRGVPIAHYIAYRVEGLRGAPLGRLP